jgi:hypothetical protein
MWRPPHFGGLRLFRGKGFEKLEPTEGTTLALKREDGGKIQVTSLI